MTLVWLEPWIAVGPADQYALECKLQRELTEGHPLYQVTARAIARRSGDDDVLFTLGNHAHPLAVVHLVWQGPQSAPWPRTRFYDDLDEWVERCMKLDRAAYTQRMQT